MNGVGWHYILSLLCTLRDLHPVIQDESFQSLTFVNAYIFENPIILLCFHKRLHMNLLLGNLQFL